MTDSLDPYAPIAHVGAVAICQRVSGTLFVRWEDGTEEEFARVFTVPMIRDEIAQRQAKALDDVGTDDPVVKWATPTGREADHE
jgi:hypothetical protein